MCEEKHSEVLMEMENESVKSSLISCILKLSCILLSEEV